MPDAPLNKGYTPANWLEWIYSWADPDIYILEPRNYDGTIQCAAGQQGQLDVKFFSQFYLFEVNTTAWLAAGGVPVLPYRVKLTGPSQEQWGSVQNAGSASAVITNDPGTAATAAAGARQGRRFMLPKEFRKDDTLNILIDNTLNPAAAITVDFAFWGYELRQRTAQTRITRT